MSQIRIEHAHGMTPKKARAAAVRVAAKLSSEFDLETRWEGNTLTFGRPGISGVLVVSAKSLEIEIELGLLYGMLRSRIESEIRDELDKQFKGS